MPEVVLLGDGHGLQFHAEVVDVCDELGGVFAVEDAVGLEELDDEGDELEGLLIVCEASDKEQKQADAYFGVAADFVGASGDALITVGLAQGPFFLDVDEQWRDLVQWEHQWVGISPIDVSHVVTAHICLGLEIAVQFTAEYLQGMINHDRCILCYMWAIRFRSASGAVGRICAGQKPSTGLGDQKLYVVALVFRA